MVLIVSMFKYGSEEERFFPEAIDFTEENITTLLIEFGLIPDKQKCHIEEFEKYIFLYGDNQEVYISEEIKFIENVGSVYIYPDIYKRTHKGMIPCRIIAVELTTGEESIRSCLFFMKIVNKGLDGFNVFLIKVNNEFYIGCRLFGKDENKNCVLSSPITKKDHFKEIAQELFYLPISNEFIPYYNVLVETLMYERGSSEGYDSIITKRRGIEYSYIKLLYELEMMYGVTFNYEKERYFRSFEEYQVTVNSIIINDVLESLSFIKSVKVNTLEMRFEAEEMTLLANETEDINERVLLEQPQIPFINGEIEDKKIKKYLDDPERLIKVMKDRKGLL